MSFRGGEFSTGTMGNFQPELTARRRGSTRARFAGYDRMIYVIGSRRHD